MITVVDLLLFKAIWRPFDLAMTKNVTSDDLNDLKN